VGRVLKWSLSIGRYIVVFTELVVILSFVTRFSLDRQVTDLNNSISQKKAIILSYGNLEEEVRLIQKKTQSYEEVRQQSNITEVFPELSKVVPPSVLLDDLTIRPDQVLISGTTLNESNLNVLINNMTLSQNFYDVAVDRIETSDDRNDPGLKFSITALTVDPEQK
jgi:Tfp pilus assembly protein PilN